MSRMSNNKKGFRILPKQKGYTVLILLTMLVAAAFLALMAVVDAFPAGLATGLMIAILIALVVECILFNRKRKGLRILGVVISAFFIAVYGMGIYYLATSFSALSDITTGENVTSAENAVDVTEDSFNVYISGIDQYTEEQGYDLERSDVNMIVTVCPKTRKILLTSIPRDTYVKLHTAGKMDKLTHTGVYGVDETLNTVEDWLDVDLNYYVKMNFTACVRLVDAIGGIDLYNPVEFKSALTQHVYPEGDIHLKGKGALFYARERKAFEGKDSLRVENQQRVVKAVLNKLMTSSALLTNYGDVLGAVKSGLELNMSQDDISALVKMQLADMSEWDIETQKLEGEYDMDYVASLTQDSKFLVYKPESSSVESIKQNIDKVMNPSEEELAEAKLNMQKNSLMSFIKSIIGSIKKK
ncbi:MAG: LCP family protein [Clostridiales bacterium]|nr:LCP family protein [Candidatus Crickella caballi]